MPYQSPGVYVVEIEPGSRPIEGVGTAVAAFVGLTAKWESNTNPALVTNWTQFLNTCGGYLPNSYLAHAVHGFFLNGGGKAWVVRVGAEASSTAATGELPSAVEDGTVAYRITSKEEGEAGNAIAVEVTDATEGDPAESFKLVVKRGGAEAESFDKLTTKAGDRHAATVVNAESQLIQLEEVGRTAVAKRRPASGTYPLGGATSEALAKIDSDDYVGNVQQRTGVGGLEELDEVTMVCVPDLMAAYEQPDGLDVNAVKGVQEAMVTHCSSLKDRIAILDPPPGLNPQEVKEWQAANANFDSAFAALYYPWLEIPDPLTGDSITVPPCGHMAGIWSRSDDERGVHKAPANEPVRGTLNVVSQVTRGEQDLLNPAGINVIRSFPGRGIRVWGARTLSSDSTWQYLNVRRLFNYIEESILEGTDWVVFEPNDEDLWQRINRTITAFLMGLWRTGALFGATPEQAFYVKCDAETNPDDVVGRGEVVIEIGISPVRPAEFVVINIRQLTGGGQVTE